MSLNTHMNKERIQITIDEEVIKEFRERFVRRKGDLSNKIQNLMIVANKGLFSERGLSEEDRQLLDRVVKKLNLDKKQENDNKEEKAE